MPKRTTACAAVPRAMRSPPTTWSPWITSVGAAAWTPARGAATPIPATATTSITHPHTRTTQPYEIRGAPINPCSHPGNGIQSVNEPRPAGGLGSRHRREKRERPARAARVGRCDRLRVGPLRRARRVRLRRGGPSAVGVAGLVRLLPAAVVAPFASSLGDRFRRERFLLAMLVLGAAALGASAAAAFAGNTALVFVFAAVLGVSSTLVRPALQALLPSLARTHRS